MEAHDISGLRSTAAASGLPEEFMDAVERLLEERFETI